MDIVLLRLIVLVVGGKNPDVSASGEDGIYMAYTRHILKIGVPGPGPDDRDWTRGGRE